MVMGVQLVLEDGHAKLVISIFALNASKCLFGLRETKETSKALTLSERMRMIRLS